MKKLGFKDIQLPLWYDVYQKKNGPPSAQIGREDGKLKFGPHNATVSDYLW